MAFKESLFPRMKKKLNWCICMSIVCSMIFATGCPALLSYGASSSSAIIADHNSATLSDLKAIPSKWIKEAKSDLHIYYNHTSHGSQVTDGLIGLAGFLSDTYAVSSSSSSSSLHLDDKYNTDLGNSDWPNITRSYLKSHSDINVVMWSWCGQVSTSSKDGINNYLNSMSKLEKEFPNVTFVYMTGHTDGSGESGNLHIRNQQIRDYCTKNNKVLFDFADIESYDPDGKYYMNKAVNDECNYDSDGNGSKDKNWATAWQGTHKKGVDWYQCGSAHTQPVNANMKAYAAWYLWARLAGWDGGTAGTTSTPTPKAAKVQPVFVEVYETMTVGEKKTFSYETTTGTTDGIVWMTSEKDIAAVAKNTGKTKAIVTAKTVGTDTVFLRYENTKLAKITVKVVEKQSNPVAKSLKWKKSVSTMKVGDKTTFSFTLEGYDLSKLRWVTGKRNGAVVGQNEGKLSAVVTAKTVGTDTVCIYEGKTKLLCIDLKITE